MLHIARTFQQLFSNMHTGTMIGSDFQHYLPPFLNHVLGTRRGPEIHG